MRACVALAAAVLAVAVSALGASPAKAGVVDAEDLIVVSGPLHVREGESVGNALVVDGRATIEGNADDIAVISGPVRISGYVEGDVLAVADRITVSRSGYVGGDLLYVDERPRLIPGAQVGGEVRRLDFEEVAIPFGFGVRFVFWLAFSASSLALGLLLLLLAPRAADAAFEAARSGVGAAVGLGIALFVGLPLAALVAIATLVGIPLGLGFLLALLPLLAVGYVTGAWLLGRALVQPPSRRVPAFLAGWAILRAIGLIPFVGGLVWFAAAVFGLGALALATWRARSPAGRPAAA